MLSKKSLPWTLVESDCAGELELIPSCHLRSCLLRNGHRRFVEGRVWRRRVALACRTCLLGTIRSSGRRVGAEILRFSRRFCLDSQGFQRRGTPLHSLVSADRARVHHRWHRRCSPTSAPSGAHWHLGGRFDDILEISSALPQWYASRPQTRAVLAMKVGRFR